MGSHSKEVNVESFEPGIAGAPFIFDVKFRGMQSNATAAQMQSRTAESLAAIGALHKSGVVIVPGSDTIVSARAMGLAKDSGTIEAGKRADLILVDGNPMANFSDIRNVSKVVANGRLFDAAQRGLSPPGEAGIGYPVSPHDAIR